MHGATLPDVVTFKVDRPTLWIKPLTSAAQAVLDAAVKRQELADKVEAAITTMTYSPEMGAALSHATDQMEDAIRAYREEQKV